MTEIQNNIDYYKYLEGCKDVPRGQSVASYGYQDFRNLVSNTSTKVEMSRNQYEMFRPMESIAKRPDAIINQCMLAAKKVGLVHNVISLMSDFASAGIQINHPVPSKQKFLREWFSKVHGLERSERFCSLLYRAGIVPIQIFTAKVPKKLDYANADIDLVVEKSTRIPKREIPVRYNFLNPCQVQPIETDLSVFTGKYIFGIKLNSALIQKINYPKNELEKEIVKNLPKNGIEAARKTGIIVLNPDKTSVYFYRKDDWEWFATPMLYSVMDQIILLEKTQLADLAALDGVISTVRVWKLGNLTTQPAIIPEPSVLNKLSNMLLANVGGGSYDIVWGPDIEVTTSSTDIQNFLGPVKYEPILNALYEGLGIPSSLRSGSSSAGLGSNYISLKTFVGRLEYGRKQLCDFWNKEFKKVCEAFDIAGVPTLSFDRMNLSDENSEKALLLQLADRDLISVETLLERFGESPELEKIRVKKEKKARKNGRQAQKSSPIEDRDTSLTKLFVGRGAVTPSEVGIELDERKDGESTLQEQMIEVKKQAGVPQQGRPKGAKDASKRKPKTLKPRAVGSTVDFMRCLSWAKETFNNICDISQPVLEQSGVVDTNTIYSLAFGVLYQLEPYSEISAECVAQAFVKDNLPIETTAEKLFNGLVHTCSEKSGISDEIIKLAYCYTYSLLKG